MIYMQNWKNSISVAKAKFFGFTILLKGFSMLENKLKSIAE